MKPIRSRLARTARSTALRFSRDRAGAIAPMFGLVMIPLLAMTVFGIDMSRALTSRNALQDATDAAGLALAHLPSNTTQADLEAKARSWITANLQDSSIGPVTVTVNSANRTVTLQATSNVASLAGGLTHVLQIPIRADATVKWGTKIELALVLDNTYSMVMNGSTKLADLKTAATTLVNTLSTATGGNPEDLKIGVVPFSVSVNVGTANQTASWISGAQPTAYGTDIFNTTGVDRFALFTTLGKSWGGCVESRPPPYDVSDDAPAAGTAKQFVPYFSPDETNSYKIGNTTYTGFNSYLDDSSSDSSLQGSKLKYNRTQKYAVDSGWGNNLSPASSNYWDTGPNMGCGGIAPILRLTTNVTDVKNKLNAMEATGTTHIPIGMVWGWHVLSPNLPFANGAPKIDVDQGKVTKVAVLATDGENTYFTDINGKYDSSYTAYGYAYQNRLGTNSFSSSASATTVMNSRLTLLCSNMKAAKIEIYTVPIQITDTTIKNLLKTCASRPANYIEVTTSAGMQTAFSDIAGSISKLRIAH